MLATELRIRRRARRKFGIRKRVIGTARRPRLTVYRSHQHIYAQLIDDERGVTLCSASTRDKGLRERVSYGGNTVAAKVVGTALAEAAKTKNIVEVAFDRNGYRYHGRLKGLADAAREAGLKF